MGIKRQKDGGRLKRKRGARADDTVGHGCDQTGTGRRLEETHKRLDRCRVL